MEENRAKGLRGRPLPIGIRLPTVPEEVYVEPPERGRSREAMTVTDEDYRDSPPSPEWDAAQTRPLKALRPSNRPTCSNLFCARPRAPEEHFSADGLCAACKKWADRHDGAQRPISAIVAAEARRQKSSVPFETRLAAATASTYAEREAAPADRVDVGQWSSADPFADVDDGPELDDDDCLAAAAEDDWELLQLEEDEDCGGYGLSDEDLSSFG